jgi:hypothetical protein
MEEVQIFYKAGQEAFERGFYRDAVAYFLQAQAGVDEQSALCGAIQLWLVNAYEANGQRDEARELCHQLSQHGNRDTRVQSHRLLYILEAPKLQLKPEWLTQIPDLNNPTAPKNSLTNRLGTTQTRTASKTSPKSKYEIPPFDPANGDSDADNGFLWIALGVALLTVVGLWWFGQTAA